MLQKLSAARYSIIPCSKLIVYLSKNPGTKRSGIKENELFFSYSIAQMRQLNSQQSFVHFYLQYCAFQ